MSKEHLCNMWCGNCKEVWNWREEEAKSRRTERVKCNMCRDKDVVVGGKVEKNKKGEVFCLPCRTEKKVPWWNWDGKLERTVPRAQKRRAGITDLKRVAGTINQKAV